MRKIQRGLLRRWNIPWHMLLLRGSHEDSSLTVRYIRIYSIFPQSLSFFLCRSVCFRSFISLGGVVVEHPERLSRTSFEKRSWTFTRTHAHSIPRACWSKWLKTRAENMLRFLEHNVSEKDKCANSPASTRRRGRQQGAFAAVFFYAMDEQTSM